MMDLGPDETAQAACVTAEFTEMVETRNGRYYDAVNWGCFGFGFP